MPLEGEAKKEYNRLAYQKKKELEKYTVSEESQTVPPGEIFSISTLYRIYKGADWREPDEDDESAYKRKKRRFVNPSEHPFGDKILTLEEWIEQRRLHRRDLWLLATTLRGKWYEKAHRPIVDFFVKKDNSSLPPKYTEDELHECILAQDTQHDRLLLYPRAFRKSTLDIIDAVQWVINFPDIVILIISSTKSLGRKLIKEFRKYFVVKDFKIPTNFQILFPEYCLTEGKGESRDSHKYECPIARLGLKDPTASYSSMESSTAGVRAHIEKFDDSVDEQNFKTAESRQDVTEKSDAACELIVRPFGYVDHIGTRYTDGKPDDSPEGAIPDLYGTLIRRNADNPDFKFLKASAWTVLPHAEGKSIKELTEDDVDLLFPEGPGAFKVLQKKCRDNEKMFRCQQLNEPAALDDQDFYINNFTEENIRAAMLDISWLPKSGKKYIFWDTALTAGRRSDYSCGVVYQIEERFGEDPVAWLLDVVYDHFTSTNLCSRIVSLYKRWTPECVFVEELPSTTDLFKRAVQEQKLAQGTSDFYINWFRPDSQAKAKETRIKGLELLLTSGRLKIVVGSGTNASSYIDEMMKQMIGYTGHRTNKNHVSGRRDDIPDSLAYVYKILPTRSSAAPTEEQKAAEEALRNKQLEDRRYQAYFSGVMGSPAGLGSQFIVRDGSNSTSAPVNEQGEVETNPIYRALGLLSNYKK